MEIENTTNQIQQPTQENKENNEIKETKPIKEIKETKEEQQLSKKALKKQQRQKAFDFSKYKTRHIALHLTYVGINYNGIQCTLFTESDETNYESIQNDQTIEYYIIKALYKTHLIRSYKECKYTRCGRTDKSVSAFGQVIDLWVRSNYQDEVIPLDKREGELDYCKMINSLLPEDIRCLGWCGVPDDFNSRFSCVSRTYHYYFDPSSYDIQRMQEAAQLFIGEHDFTNFCKKDPQVPHHIRRVNSFDIEQVNGISRFVICGTAFLWHQVRYMVGALFAIGQGERKEIISEMLDVENYERPTYFKYADGYPLVLYECKFDNVKFLSEEGNVRFLAEIVDYWKEWNIKQMMRKSLMEMALSQPMYDNTTVAEKIQNMKKKKTEIKPRKIKK